jgi:hypothetical protein
MWLVETYFTQGTQYWTNWPVSVDWNGHTYLGLGEIGAVGSMQETESGVDGKMLLSLSPVKIEILSLALGNVEGYRGKPVNVYLWPVDSTYQPIGTPVLRYFGVMDQVGVKRNGSTGMIEMSCLPAGANSKRRSAALRMNHVQQQLVHPGDRGFEYIEDLTNNPQLWLSKAFQARV